MTRFRFVSHLAGDHTVIKSHSVGQRATRVGMREGMKGAGAGARPLGARPLSFNELPPPQNRSRTKCFEAFASEHVNLSQLPVITSMVALYVWLRYMFKNYNFAFSLTQKIQAQSQRAEEMAKTWC